MLAGDHAGLFGGAAEQVAWPGEEAGVAVVLVLAVDSFAAARLDRRNL